MPLGSLPSSESIPEPRIAEYPGRDVASVDHPGNNALAPPTVAGVTLWWMRANDLSHVIDGVLATPQFGVHIDQRRIGAPGFSLGGYTVLVIAGARGDAARLGPYCAHHPTRRSARARRRRRCRTSTLERRRLQQAIRRTG
ncbi:MAG: hypothetical protein M3R44_07090 [Candidatus Eremiobacteraeota bacterium]|nr:hypothetical protein [Candidatus Eremiobacteraeota bacterium]